MRISFPSRFRFRPIPFIATALLVALGISLAQWQERRAAQKIALQAVLTARSVEAPLDVGAAPLDGAALEYRRVRVTGQFVRDWALYLDNRPYQSRAGFYVLMPLRLGGTDRYVLVERGWLPRNTAARDRLPHFDTPEGTVTLEGVIKSKIGHVMELGTAAPLAKGAIVQNLTVAQFGAASGLAMQDFFIEQSGPSPAGEPLVRDWPAPALDVARNQGYAFQWYALAATAFLFFVITGFRRGTKQSN